MSLALAPFPGSEMDDSIMQDDHAADVAITIDMDSPKHHELTPQAMVFADIPAPQGFWIQTPTAEVNNQLVDVEFETEGAGFDEDGMMSAAEVEMTAAPVYVEEYEYEMSYETGQPEVHYEIEDTVVHDAEVLDAAPAHEPHVDSTVTELLHSQPVRPREALVATDADAEAPHEEAAVLEVSELIPGQSEVVGDAYPTELTYPESYAAEEEVKETEHPQAVEEKAPGTAIVTIAVETAEPATSAPATEVAEDKYEDADAATDGETTSTAAALEVKAEQEPAVAPELQHYAATTTDTEEPVEEPSVDAYAPNAYGETEVDNKFSEKVPPVILTSFSESSKTPRVLVLFESPDSALIASSSKQYDGPLPLLLEQHHYLFLEPVSAFLIHLRTELLQAQPEIIPPAEFEYKELQLVVRDLQLILTEDNIYAREITLFDLETMHKACGLPGYLHLDVSLQPRFIDRYRAIREAIDTHGMQTATTISDQEINQLQDRREDTTTEEDAKVIQEGKGLMSTDQRKEHELEHEETAFDGTTTQEDGAYVEEPPLPPDDEAASSWSEEHDELEGDGPPLLAGDDVDNEWEEVYDPEAGEVAVPTAEEHSEAQNEELVHEDDFIAGDLPEITAEDEPADNVDGDVGEEPPVDNAEYAIEVPEKEEEELSSDQEVFEAAGYDDEAQAAEGNIHPETTERAHSEEEQNFTKDNTGAEAEYIDDEEWDEQDHDKDALERETDPEAAAQDQGQTDATTPAPRVEPEGADAIDPLVFVKGKTAHHDESTAPVRKRSFSEVEVEPEDDLKLSPNSKKPRHI